MNIFPLQHDEKTQIKLLEETDQEETSNWTEIKKGNICTYIFQKRISNISFFM